MAKVRSWAGLDVHAAKVLACVVDAESGEMTVHRLAGETAAVVAFCAGLPGPTRVAYEAGPTGYGLARALIAAEVECVVAAPGKIERPAQDRVKTDQRDSERLVRLLMIGALRSVHEGRIEVLGRDLSRLGGRELVEVRRDIGFIFQMHNLFDALSAYENVKMAAQLGGQSPIPGQHLSQLVQCGAALGQAGEPRLGRRRCGQ